MTSCAERDPLRVGLLVIGRKRRGFDMPWGSQMEAAAWSAAAAWEFRLIKPETRVVDDPSLRSALQELRAAGCDALVVMQPIMGDGRLAPVLAQQWNGPLVLWATPERPDGDKVSSCSLVGTHVFATIFRQLQRPFELVYGHPDDERIRQQMGEAVRLAAAAARLRRSKVGLIGYHAPGFINMHVDPVATSRQLGVELQHIGLQEFLDLVDDQSADEVTADVETVRGWNLPFASDTGPEDLITNSRYYLALKALLRSEHLDAAALRCWPELPNRLGAWPYLAMARLAEEHRVVALEGDVDGAISCWLGQLLGFGPGYLSDWLEHDASTITLWHPGHAPRDGCVGESLQLGRHFNSGHPLVINAELAPERPITLFRLWRCDGRYHMSAWHAHTTQPRRKLAGVHGLAVLDRIDVPGWFDRLCHAGMPHHVVVFPGHHATIIRRLARQLCIDWLEARD